MKVIIPGGTGQIGSIAARWWHEAGHEVTVLSRSAHEAPWSVVVWDGQTLGAWAERFDGADVVLNLAGRSVNCRYNATNRYQIMRSRLDSTRMVGQAIGRAANPPSLWLQASTATIYKHGFDAPNDEATGVIEEIQADAHPSWRFSIEVAQAWERALAEARTPHTRRVALRSAMVMSPHRDGVFDVLSTLVRRRLGGKAGSGRQFVSWIHEYDFLRALQFLIDHPEMNGAVNLASPNPLPNAKFMEQLRQAWGIKVGLPATEWMLELGAIVMQTESELILKSRRVIPGRLSEAKFEFQYPEWAGAATELVERNKQQD